VSGQRRTRLASGVAPARLFTAANHVQANEARLAELSPTFGRDRLDWLLVRVRITRDHTMTPSLADSPIAYGTDTDYHLVQGNGAE